MSKLFNLVTRRLLKNTIRFKPEAHLPSGLYNQSNYRPGSFYTMKPLCLILFINLAFIDFVEKLEPNQANRAKPVM